MNPFDILTGAGGGSGGFQGSSSATASGQSGPAGGTNTTGTKNINFGAAPNTIAGVLTNPLFLLAVGAGLFLIVKR